MTERITSRLFAILKVFLCVLSRFYSFCVGVAKAFPETLYQAKSKYNLNQDRFKRYVVCKKCHQVYFLNVCIDVTGSSRKSRLCSFKGLEKHQCGTLLLKFVELRSGTKIFLPFLTYCYIDLKTSMQRLLMRSHFVEKCEIWRHHNSSDSALRFIYDGKVWKDFQSYDGIPFLSEPLSFAFVLNIDWFQPYKHLSYSVGAIYLTVLNCQVTLDFMKTILYLLAFFLDHTNPSLLLTLTCNLWWMTCLSSGMESHLIFQKRVINVFVVHSFVCHVTYQLVVKHGFLGHTAHLGCAKCKKVFTGGFGQSNYSGFDRENWTWRSNESQQSDALKLLHCRTKTDLKQKSLHLVVVILFC